MAMKVISQDVVRKTEQNAVVLGIAPNNAVSAYNGLMRNFSGMRVDGILIQPMVKGIEFFIGATRDEQFGPVVTFGVGGTQMEVLPDVAHGVSRLTLDDAKGMIGRIKSQKLLSEKGFRGMAPVGIDALATAIVGVSELMWQNPQISELDLNPVVWDGKGLQIIDPRLISGEVTPELRCEPMPEWKSQGLDGIFSPKSYAIIGASTKSPSVPDTVVREMLRRSDGDAYPINPNFSENSKKPEEYAAYKKSIQDFLANIGKPSLKVAFCSSIAGLPNGVDLGVFVTKGETVPGPMREFGEKGGKGVVVVSDGFKESGRKDLDDEINSIAQEFRMAMIGPNCLGVYAGGANTMFIPTDRAVSPKIGGGIGGVFQSGGIMLDVLEFLAHQDVGVRSFVSCGNASCTTITDLLRYYGADPGIKALSFYVESVPNGVEFYEALKEVCARKPVIIIKGGTTEEGAAATASHTGAVTKNIDVFRDACSQAGAILIGGQDGIRTMADALSLLATQPKPPAYNVQVVTVGGGIGIKSFDYLVGAGVVPAVMSDETIGLLKQVGGLEGAQMPSKGPLDILGSAGDARTADVMRILNSDSGIGAVYMIPYFQVPGYGNDAAAAFGGIKAGMQKPLIISQRGEGGFFLECKRTLLENGVVTYDDRAPAAVAVAMQAWERYPNIDFRQ